MQLLQKLFRKPQGMPTHELAVIDFGHGGCITITSNCRRLGLPGNRDAIVLRNTKMSHRPYGQCGGTVVYRPNFGWLVCRECARMWMRPLEVTTLGSLMQHFHDAGFACVWMYDKRVMDGTAPL
mgnify:CR=1 FL=1